MSIRLRLGTWYGALTATVVVLVCLYAYSMHVRTHYDELDEVLQMRTEHVAEMFAAANSSAERRAALDMAVPLGIAVRLSVVSNGMLRETASAGDAPPFPPAAIEHQAGSRLYPMLLAGLPSPHVPHVGRGAFGVVPAAHRWRVYVVGTRGDERLAGLVPLAPVDEAVRRYAFVLCLLGITGVAGAFALGWLIAGHALRPIAQLTSTAGAIARSGAPSRRVPVGRERDELGTLARTFNQMLARLEDVQALQQRFVSDASHEIRAPLTVIRANLELLERAERLPAAERCEALREARAEADRLTRLVADLLALARADAGVHLQRESVELDRLLMTVIGDARHLLTDQRLEIAAIEPTVLRGDGDRLKQLLLILLDNAIRYTPAGGRITVALRVENATAVITVADTGIGIGASDLERVFERFYRADPARSRAPGGTGLGLAIAQWIVRQHGGSVHLASVQGRGTTARVDLPLEPTSAPAAGASASDLRVNVGGGTWRSRVAAGRLKPQNA